MNLFRKLFSKKQDSFQREGIICKVAFTCGGEEYLEVADIYSLPYQRGFAAVRVYEEMKMKCDYDYLKAHVQAVDNLFKGKKIGFEEITQMKKLNDQIKERLFQIIDTDIIYKLASVVFFDKNESPLDYDFAYAQKKIAHWKKHASVTDFFLQEPLTRLIPFLKAPDLNLESYLEVIKKVNAVHWKEVWAVLSENQRKALSGSYDYYVKETFQESVN